MASNDQCIICGNGQFALISNEIREGEEEVLQCDECGFVFLKDFERVRYEEDYGSLTLDEAWDYETQLLQRAKSLKRATNFIVDICEKLRYKKLIEIGSGIGASIFSVKDLLPDTNIDCVENNKRLRSHLEKRFNGTKAYKEIDDVNDTYDLVFGIQVFEHFPEPLSELKKIEKILNKRGRLYLLFPNHDDWYKKVLPKNSLREYHKFMFHEAHPFYFTIDSFKRLISKTNFEIDEITTFQDYSVANFMNWYVRGKPSKNIAQATYVDEKLIDLQREFVRISELRHNGNNISALLKKKQECVE
jgi:cyclopropane fatty-acyl-phospholipid synthase-like methyltransferase